MPALQEQDEDLAGAHSVRGETALPRAGIDEHCCTDVHQEIWGLSAIGGHWRLRGSVGLPEAFPHDRIGAFEHHRACG